jgi:sugar/nucleoside kinase (ribokinase family)
MLDSLRERGIDTAGIVVDPVIKTGLTVILSRGNDRAILTYLGSIAALRPDEVDQAAFARARHLHLGSYYLLDALRPAIPELYAAAKISGLSTSLDTNYDPREAWDGGLDDVLAHTDIFLPNAAELLAITRTADVDAGLAQLRDRVGTVAVKLGEQGSRAVQGEREARAGIVPVDLVDTTGAGDSFDAGFIFGHLAGWELARTLRFAGACGSLSTRAAGGTQAQATLAEALAVL